MAHDIYELTKNGERIHAGSEDSCYIKLQRVQPHSSTYALRYDGYKVSSLECSDEEAMKIIEADPFWKVEVILAEDFKKLTNHHVMVTTLDGKSGIANTYAMNYSSTTKGSHVFVMRSYLIVP